MANDPASRGKAGVRRICSVLPLVLSTACRLPLSPVQVLIRPLGWPMRASTQGSETPASLISPLRPWRRVSPCGLCQARSKVAASMRSVGLVMPAVYSLVARNTRSPQTIAKMLDKLRRNAGQGASAPPATDP